MQAKDFTGRDANGLGLVRRIENMVTEIPAYRGEVEHRQGFARTRTEELLAVADVPFEHEAQLRDKEHELATLTAQLHLDANSPQAHARAEAARERLAAQGRQPGWSLALNPTPAMRAELAETDTTRDLPPGPAHPGGLAPARAGQHRETPPAAVSTPPTARQLIHATMAPEVVLLGPASGVGVMGGAVVVVLGSGAGAVVGVTGRFVQLVVALAVTTTAATSSSTR